MSLWMLNRYNEYKNRHWYLHVYLFLDMYVYIYTCVCIDYYLYMYIFQFIYHISIFIYAYMRMYQDTRIRHPQEWWTPNQRVAGPCCFTLYTQTHIYIYIYICLNIYIYMHTFSFLVPHVWIDTSVHTCLMQRSKSKNQGQVLNTRRCGKDSRLVWVPWDKW